MPNSLPSASTRLPVSSAAWAARPPERSTGICPVPAKNALLSQPLRPRPAVRPAAGGRRGGATVGAGGPMSAGPARPGRRDNGLTAAAYAAVGDVDPRVGEHLLDVLAAAGIAAYLQPSSDLHPITRTT